jgi:hypothetical protein
MFDQQRRRKRLAIVRMTSGKVDGPLGPPDGSAGVLFQGHQVLDVVAVTRKDQQVFEQHGGRARSFLMIDRKISARPDNLSRIRGDARRPVGSEMHVDVAFVDQRRWRSITVGRIDRFRLGHSEDVPLVNRDVRNPNRRPIQTTGARPRPRSSARSDGPGRRATTSRARESESSRSHFPAHSNARADRPHRYGHRRAARGNRATQPPIRHRRPPWATKEAATEGPQTNGDIGSWVCCPGWISPSMKGSLQRSTQTHTPSQVLRTETGSIILPAIEILWYILLLRYRELYPRIAPQRRSEASAAPQETSTAAAAAAS